MCREDDGRSLLLEAEDLLTDHLCVDRVEARERLVKDEELWLVDHGGDELDLLGHTLREFLHLLVPPALDAESDEPFLEFVLSLAIAHSLELREVHGLLTYLHLAVETTLLRQISDLLDIVLSDRTAVEKYCSRVWNRDAVDDTDQSGLSGSVRAEQTEDLSLGDINRHIVESDLLSEGLRHILAFNYSHYVVVLIFHCHPEL